MKHASFFLCLLIISTSLFGCDEYLICPYTFTHSVYDCDSYVSFTHDQPDPINPSYSNIFYEKHVDIGRASYSISPTSIAVTVGKYSAGFDTSQFAAFVFKKVASCFTSRKQTKQFVQKYNHWNRNDFEQGAFKRIADVQMCSRSGSYISAEKQRAILSEHHLYQFDGFRAFIKTLPEYESYIKELHTTVARDLRVKNKWWKTLPGFSQQSFADIIHCLNCQVTDAQKTRERCAQARVKAEQRRRQRFRKTVQSHADYLQQCVHEYAIKIQTSDDNDPAIKRLQARIDAINEAHKNNYQLTVTSYELSQHTQQFLSDCSVQQSVFVRCDGTIVQQQIHREIITVLDQTAALHYTYERNQSMHLLTNTIGTMAGITSEFNARGHIQKAFTLADCCLAFRDCAIGIAEGLGDGVYNTAHAILNPKETVFNMARGVATASWCVGKVLYEIGEIRINLLINPEIGQQQLEHLWTQVETIAIALADKIAETPVRQLTRMTTANLFEAALTKKCLSCMHIFYQGVQQEILTVIKNIEQGMQPPLALAGYPGALIAGEAAGLLPLLAQEGNTANFMQSSIIGQIAKNIPNEIQKPKKIIINISGNPNILKPLGRGSTGRTEAANLTEKLVMEEVVANPYLGRIIDVEMTDSRWLHNDGWKKLSWYNKEAKVEIHYIAQYKNGAIVAIDDFKFKKP